MRFVLITLWFLLVNCVSGYTLYLADSKGYLAYSWVLRILFFALFIVVGTIDYMWVQFIFS